jgi:hypothetical protein
MEHKQTGIQFRAKFRNRRELEKTAVLMPPVEQCLLPLIRRKPRVSIVKNVNVFRNPF